MSSIFLNFKKIRYIISDGINTIINMGLAKIDAIANAELNIKIGVDFFSGPIKNKKNADTANGFTANKDGLCHTAIAPLPAK